MRRLGHVGVGGVQETAAGHLKLGVDVRGGDETVVADLDESSGQNVQEESAHEFRRPMERNRTSYSGGSPLQALHAAIGLPKACQRRRPVTMLRGWCLSSLSRKNSRKTLAPSLAVPFLAWVIKAGLLVHGAVLEPAPWFNTPFSPAATASVRHGISIPAAGPNAYWLAGWWRVTL